MQSDLGFETRLLELSRLLVAETPIDKLLQDVADLTADAVPGCDHCGVTLVRDDNPETATTAAATNPATYVVDDSQYKMGEGPCLQAILTCSIISVDDFSTDKRFPKFRSGALEAGLKSSLSFPLQAGGRCIGALNMYSLSPASFDDLSRSIGLRLAEHASIALANAQTHQDAMRAVEHLTKALDRRGTIEQAKGILMASRRIDQEAAFDILRKASQFQNKKLFDVANEVLQTHLQALALANNSVDMPTENV